MQESATTRTRRPGRKIATNRRRAWPPIAALLTILLAGCAVVPTHEVLPYPDHIKAGVAPGDKLRVTMRNGATKDVVVTDTSETQITTESESLQIEDIKRITTQSWSLPGNPCDDERPLGCSVHPLVTVASEPHAEYTRVLEVPCAQHDYCYRYGFQTYALEREDCDEKFLNDMRALCKTEFKLDIFEQSECLSIAAQMHSAVIGFGEEYFHRDAYCEYAGPPAHVLWKAP